ncbi:unnamed protein product [Camellia sinensis]
MIDSHKRIAIDNGTDDIVSGCAWPAKKFNRQHFRAHARLRCSKDEYLVKKLENEAFVGFRNLTSLHFEKMAFAANIFETPVPSVPLPETLNFSGCTGIEHFNIHSPKLKTFVATDSHDVRSISFRSTPNLTMISIALGKKAENPWQGSTINLNKFLDNFPRILKICFVGFFQLKHFVFTKPRFVDVDQMSCVLCLLRSSPNLKKLRITDNAVEPVPRYLEALGCMYQLLNPLRTVKITSIKGLRAELLFIKCILACSPVLEMICGQYHQIVDAHVAFRISTEMMWFSRASPRVEIVYVSPNKPRDKSHSLGTVDQDSSVCEAVFYKMAHKLLKQQSFHDSPPAHSRFSTLHSRFSTLPVEVKLKILEHIPFEEAARTSILSRTSNWSEHSQVILDKLLFEERGRWIALHPTEWVNKVTKILSNHREGLIPIRKFILHIPDMQFNWALYINIWIPFLSSNGIRELSVDNWNINTFKLSSFLLECYELTRLILRNCIFKKSVEGFRNLRFLHLEKIAFGSKIVGAVTISAPSLVRSELVDCTGFQHLNIHAPKLENFIVASGDGMSRDDANQMRLKLGGKTIDEEEGRGRNCRSCGGCCRWREPGYRVKYVFYPGNGRKQFVFSPQVRARW